MEDSDATVAPDLDEDELEYHGDVYEASLPCSPSILQTNNMVSAPVSRHVFSSSMAVSIDTGNYNNKDECSIEMVPCSSDETSGATEEELSQEYLPPIYSKPLEAQSCELVARASTTTNNLTLDGKGECGSILDRISADQDRLMSELDQINENYGNIIPPNFSKDTKGKLLELQKKLKTASESHQEERKRLIVTYTSLSQDHSLTGNEGKPLRSQLVSLSVRHKKLLQLFSIQKEIGGKLEKLEEREARAKKTVELSVRGTSPIVIPNLARHLVHPLPHHQDLRTMPTNITATLLPGRDVPTTYSEAPMPNTKPSQQTQASSQPRVTRSSIRKATESLLNQPPVLSNPDPLSSQVESQAQVMKPSAVKLTNISSNKQTPLLSLAQSKHLSMAQVRASLQTNQAQALSQSLSKHPPTSTDLPTQPNPVSSSQLNPAVQSSRKMQQVSNQARAIKYSAMKPTDCSLKKQAVPSSILPPNQRQPKPSSSVMKQAGQSQPKPSSSAVKQADSSLKTQLHPSSSVPPSQSQPKPSSAMKQADSSLKTQLHPSSSIPPSQSQPKPSSSAMKQIDTCLETQPLPSSVVPPNQSQPKPLCFSQQLDPTIARTNKPTSSSELTQPVPLEVLIQHKILESKPSSLTCTILGCAFIGSLLEDGSIQEAPAIGKGSPNPPGQSAIACLHRQPQLWVKACWGHLGHANKSVTKKQAYSVITYLEKTLSHYCEQYSLKQVSTFLTHKKQHRAHHASAEHQETESQVPPDVPNEPKESETDFSQLPMESSRTASAVAQPPPLNISTTTSTTEFDLGVLLLTGQILLVSGRNESLKLPGDFWKDQDLTKFIPEICCQIENNFDW